MVDDHSSPKSIKAEGPYRSEDGKLQYHATLTLSSGQAFILSSLPTNLDHTAINKALDDEALFWARSLSPTNLATMLSNSFCLGLYILTTSNPSSSPYLKDLPQHERYQQIGLARLITDHVTFAWLTDVYILPEFQGKGLGKWMLKALREIFGSMQELRRAMFITERSGTKGYERELGARIWEGEEVVVMQVGGAAGGSLGVGAEA